MKYRKVLEPKDNNNKIRRVKLEECKTMGNQKNYT